MSDFLTAMARVSADRAAAAQGSVQSAQLDLPVVPLKLATFDVIAEIKNRSPSEGVLAEEARNRGELATRYVEGGAAAISVLTEPTQFAGELNHLEEVARVVQEAPVPVMRKDFLVDPVQVLEARAAGASGVLLIVTMLSDRQLGDMLACAREHSMFVLLESFDVEDLRRSRALLDGARQSEQAESGKLLVGDNSRDLRSLHVDPDRLKSLGRHLPPAVACVAESGLCDERDAAAAAGWGYSVALVGTALMRAADPRGLLGAMLAAGRERRAA
jgi:indole-3-glycerol phosphate synthase